MRHLYSVLLLAFFTTPAHSWGAAPVPFLPSPVLVYDCNLSGTFQFSQVLTEGNSKCPEGYGIKTRFLLKSFLVMDGEASAVWIRYAECHHEDGRRHKAYWFHSEGNYDYPDFCDLYVTQPNRIDSLSDGIKVRRGVLQPSSAFGKKSERHILDCYQAVCVIPIDDEYCNYFVSNTLDLKGALSVVKLSTTIPSKKDSFKSLHFCDGPLPARQSRSAEICAPRTLSGTFSSYFADTNGITDATPNFDLIDIEEDLLIEPEYLPDNPVPGYHSAAIYGNYSCRLNAEFTAIANLFDPVCSEGNDGYGYLDTPGGNNPDPRGDGVFPCIIEPGDLHYGVLLVALYLESKGYVFDEDDLECAVDTAFGLPADVR